MKNSAKSLLSIVLATGLFLTACSDTFESRVKRSAVGFSDLSDVEHITGSVKDHRLVLLGEASHGTSEYYSMRAEISKKLISEKGFSFVAVEGDWASIYRLNLYVKGLYEGPEKSAEEIMMTFSRWPVWMWANRETAELVEWLKEFNSGKELKDMAGFYGIDVYGQWEAMERLLSYTERKLPDDFDRIKEKTDCFSRFGDEWQYARAVVQGGLASCYPELEKIKNMLVSREEELIEKCRVSYFEAVQNATVLKKAEEYYRLAMSRGPESWNSRATHFYHTVTRLLDYYGEGSKGIVWAHNTHVGDSRATDMFRSGMVNIGMLAREDLGRKNVFIAGFVTFSGRVLAGRRWAAPMENMRVPDALHGSLGHRLNSLGMEKFSVVFDKEELRSGIMLQPVPHRAIGVTYSPENERGNYVPSVIPERYDALIFIRQTGALETFDD